MAGHGTAAGERGTVRSWSTLLDDVEDRVAALRSDLPGLPVGIYGHGLGGLIAADYLESERPQPDIALLLSPSLEFAARIPSWRLALMRRFGSGGIRLVPDASALAVDEALVGDWRRDPLVIWEFAPAFIEMVQEAQRRAAAGLGRIQLPLLILHGDQDPIAVARGWSDLRAPWDIDRPMSIISGQRHDVPNDEGWRERSGWHRSFLRGAGERHWPATTPASGPPHRYERMPRAQAVAEFEAYVAGEAERLHRFDQIVAEKGGPDPGCERESMDRFGAWLIDALEWGEPSPDPPTWAPRVDTGHELSADSIALIDGLATRIAACFRAAASQLEWRLCTTKMDAYYHRPILEPLHLCPPIPATKVLSVARHDEPDRHWLGKIWDAWERNLEDTSGSRIRRGRGRPPATRRDRRRRIRTSSVQRPDLDPRGCRSRPRRGAFSGASAAAGQAQGRGGSRARGPRGLPDPCRVRPRSRCRSHRRRRSGAPDETSGGRGI